MQVFAAVVVLVVVVALFDDEQVTAVAACPVYWGRSAAVASGLEHGDHLNENLLLCPVHVDPPFGSVHGTLPFCWMLPFEPEQALPSRRVCYQGPLAAALCQ